MKKKILRVNNYFLGVIVLTRSNVIHPKKIRAYMNSINALIPLNCSIFRIFPHVKV